MQLSNILKKEVIDPAPTDPKERLDYVTSYLQKRYQYSYNTVKNYMNRGYFGDFNDPIELLERIYEIDKIVEERKTRYRHAPASPRDSKLVKAKEEEVIELAKLHLGKTPYLINNLGQQIIDIIDSDNYATVRHLVVCFLAHRHDYKYNTMYTYISQNIFGENIEPKTLLLNLYDTDSVINDRKERQQKKQFLPETPKESYVPEQSPEPSVDLTMKHKLEKMAEDRKRAIDDAELMVQMHLEAKNVMQEELDKINAVLDILNQGDL